MTDPNDDAPTAAMRRLIEAWHAYYLAPTILAHQTLRYAVEEQEQLVMLADAKLVPEPCLNAGDDLRL